MVNFSLISEKSNTCLVLTSIHRQSLACAKLLPKQENPHLENWAWANTNLPGIHSLCLVKGKGNHEHLKEKKIIFSIMLEHIFDEISPLQSNSHEGKKLIYYVYYIIANI